jgi:hypothetical protein
VLTAALAAGYLMLFNPRTLSSSYVMTASFAGIFAAVQLFEHGRALGLVMVFACLAWTVNRHWHGFAFTQYWLKPAAGVAFLVVLVREALAPLPGWRAQGIVPQGPPVHWSSLGRCGTRLEGRHHCSNLCVAEPVRKAPQIVEPGGTRRVAPPRSEQ